MDTQNVRQHLKAFKVDTWLSVTCAALVALGLLATIASIRQNANVKPAVAIEKSDWHASFEITSGCPLDGVASKECPANPDNKALWASPMKRDSEGFLKRYKSENGIAFWIGTQVPAETLKKADKLGATTLLLPKMNGTVQVWIDGVYQKTHDYAQAKVPLSITISKARLKSGHDLTIALGVFPYPHQPVPEKNAQETEGFFTAQAADDLAQSVVFLSSGQNLIAVALFLLLGIFLWSVSSTGRTRDYAVGTQLALVIALTTLFSVDLSFQVFTVATYESLFFSLLLLETVLIARFTWTVLQGSRSTSIRETIAIIACVALPIFANFSGWIEATGVNLMTSWILPLAYLASAGAIAVRLRRILSANLSSRTRRHFLMFACASMVATGLSYLFESHHQSGFHVVYSRWLNFIMLMGLVRVFIKSHQTKSSLIELSPSSSYHRQEPMPETVEGWILHVEIQKFSRDRQVMSTIVSHLWTIAKLHDADIIKAEEGALDVLFRDESQISVALKEMAKCVRDLESRLPIVFTSRTSLVFRAAVSRGRLSPAWNRGENGVSKIPAWIDTDGKLAELREIVRDEALPRDRSVVLTNEALEIPAELRRAG